jgi:two-component system cell cycle response regulator
VGAAARVLVVDDDRVLRTMLRAHLARAGHAVTTAPDGAGALALAASMRPDVILLDLELPDVHGLEVLDRLQTMPETAGTPVLVITSHTEDDVIVEALQRGAQDYLAKPPSWGVLDARLGVAIRLKRLQDELVDANLRLSGLASTDELTGVANRRAGGALLDAAVAAGTEGRRPVVVKVDVDRFKLVNDVYGHATGDEVLRHVAGALAAHLRHGDEVVRWGGDEFVAVLHDAGEQDARTVAERLRRAVADAPELVGLGGVSVSVGWAAWDGHTAEELLEAADAAMYAAKRAGRNAVRGADAPRSERAGGI